MNILSSSIASAALAIVISWALFAIFCSLVHEAVAQIKAERGRFMRKYLFKQLQDLPNGVNWASMLYLHGTIDLLSREPDKPTSEIKPDTFAKTLIEVVGSAHIVQMQLPLLQQKLLEEKGEGSNTSRQPHQFVNSLQNNFSQPLLYNFKAATQLLKPSSVVSMLHQAINEAELKANAKGNSEWVTEADIYLQLQNFLEKWYNDFTGRLTLWYQKKTRLRLFILGCVFGLFLNIDSVQLFSFYTTNPDSREAVIHYYEQNADTLALLANRVENTNAFNSASTDSVLSAINFLLPASTSVRIHSALNNMRIKQTPPVPASPQPEVLTNAAAKAAADSVAAGLHSNKNSSYNSDTAQTGAVDSSKKNNGIDTLRLLSRSFVYQADSLRQTANLPIGFHYNVFSQRLPIFSYDMLLKLFGILISGLAASFGAPFWFELLRKIYTRK